MVKLINLYSNSSRFIDIHPAEKILLIVISLVSCSYTNNIFIIMSNIILFVSLNIIAKNPLVIVKKFIGAALLFTLFTTITMIWQGQSYELISLVIIRGINGAFTLAFLTLTTPINQIVAIMSKWEWTRDIADIIKSMERFIILLEDDVQITFNAIKCRGGFCGPRNTIKDFGMAFGVVFKNLIYRWKDVNISLKNRCYTGRHNYYFDFSYNDKRVLGIVVYFIIMLSSVILFK